MVITGENMFMASIAPSRIIIDRSHSWNNLQPTSAPDVLKGPIDNITQQIEVMNPAKIAISVKTVISQHKFYLTMINENVLNKKTDTKSTRSCAICKNLQKDLRNWGKSSTENY